jgi:hypothetical protein
MFPLPRSQKASSSWLPINSSLIIDTMSTAALKNESDESFEQVDMHEPVPPEDIVAYNELRSCADLFRMYTSGKLEIQPDFQREVVWKPDDQTRFIDSLVKQLPIPSMCFSLDFKTQKWKVIDGLQRMSTIIHFLSKEEWKLSDLHDIHPLLRNAKNTDLSRGTADQSRLFALVEDVSIPVTVIRCDYSQPSHMLYLFTIFHRLNSGGVRLTNQEIRNCIYSGPFNDFLKSFDAENKHWKAIKKRIWGSTDRFRSVEVLLRILAFSDSYEGYDGNLARFLNRYMQERMSDEQNELADLPKKLEVTASVVQEILVSENQRKLPLLLIEALMVAVFKSHERLVNTDAISLTEAYHHMKLKAPFAEGARYAVSSADNVQTRLKEAIETFTV